MAGMFANCKSLTKLPNISDWVIGHSNYDQHYIFTFCKIKRFYYISHLDKKKDIYKIHVIFTICFMDVQN